jgi:hypothetical protein
MGGLRIPLVYSSRGQGDVETGQVAGSGPVQRVVVPVGVQAGQVERDRGEHVLQPGGLLRDFRTVIYEIVRLRAGY